MEEFALLLACINIVEERRNLLITSLFSFSCHAFYPFPRQTSLSIKIFFPSHRLSFHIAIIKTIVTNNRRGNSLAMSSWGSNQHFPDLKSCMLLTEPQKLAKEIETKFLFVLPDVRFYSSGTVLYTQTDNRPLLYTSYLYDITSPW